MRGCLGAGFEPGAGGGRGGVKGMVRTSCRPRRCWLPQLEQCPPQLSGHLKSGEDPGLPRPASRRCSEPCGLNGHNCGVGGASVVWVSSRAPSAALVLAAGMDGGEHPDVGGHTGALGGPQAVVRYPVRLVPRSACTGEAGGPSWFPWYGPGAWSPSAFSWLLRSRGGGCWEFWGGFPEGPVKSWAWALGPWDLQELLAEQSSSQGSPLLGTQPPDVCQRPPWSFPDGRPLSLTPNSESPSSFSFPWGRGD